MESSCLLFGELMRTPIEEGCEATASSSVNLLHVCCVVFEQHEHRKPVSANVYHLVYFQSVCLRKSEGEGNSFKNALG